MILLAVLISIIASSSAGLLLWYLYGLPGLISLTTALLEFCSTLLVKCVEYSYVLKAASIWLGITLIAGGFLYALFRALSGVIRAHLSLKRLPLKNPDSNLVLIDEPASMAAFTHGLLRPRIYMSKGLLSSLESAERKAVFLHELCHRRRRDPLRFFLLSFLRDMFFSVPIASFIVSRIKARDEEEADRYAVEAMNEPVSLSSALIKAAWANVSVLGSVTHFTGGGGGGGGGGVEDRVKRLIEGRKAGMALPGLRPVFISLMTSSLILASLALPLSPRIKAVGECSLTHCELHAERLGTECKTHCKTPLHKHSLHTHQ